MMFEPTSNHASQARQPESRNPWAIVDLVIFGLFFLVMVVLAAPFSRLSVVYAIPLQGIFNLVLIGFIAGWVKLVRRSSFAEYIHWLRSHTFSTHFLIALGASTALAVLVISARLPSTGQTPLEKLLTSNTAIVVFGIFGVAVAPLLEEVIFRGFLFQVLWEIGGSRVAIIASAVVFALLHAGQLAGNWGGVALIFVVGCILSVVRHRSNSIISSFIVHTSYNSLLFVLFIVSALLQRIFPS
jgi:membrane protease YdiL (CAAX protease family)